MSQNRIIDNLLAQLGVDVRNCEELLAKYVVDLREQHGFGNI